VPLPSFLKPLPSFAALPQLTLKENERNAWQLTGVSVQNLLGETVDYRKEEEKSRRRGEGRKGRALLGIMRVMKCPLNERKAKLLKKMKES